MQKKYPNETNHIEIPKSLNSNEKRNYSPQNIKLDGYSQMPRVIAKPYVNQQLITERNFARKKRSI